MNRSEAYDPKWSKLGAPLAAQAVPNVRHGQQYSLAKFLMIWAAAALPMAILGWVVAPLVGGRIDWGVGDANNVAMTRAGLLLIGLIWQFVLAMAIILREEGNLRWSTIRERCWLNAPRSPKDGKSHARLWLLVLPLLVLVAVIQLSPLQALWDQAFPFLGEPGKYSFEQIMQSGERKAALEGAWQLLGLFVVLGLFNTVLGEELLFRGILLPKMQGVFGKGDWLANGVLFGIYHLHQPWSIAGSMVEGVLCLAFPSRRYRSAWIGVIVHSAQTVFFIFAALGLVLGMA